MTLLKSFRLIIIIMTAVTCSYTGCFDIGPTASFQIFNDTADKTFYYLYIYKSGSSSKGKDQLQTYMIAPGGNYTVISIPAEKTYDVWVEDASGFYAADTGL